MKSSHHPNPGLPFQSAKLSRLSQAQHQARPQGTGISMTQSNSPVRNSVLLKRDVVSHGASCSSSPEIRHTEQDASLPM